MKTAGPDITTRQWWAVLGAVSASLLAPLLIIDVPPVLDYPNHLARLVLLAAGPDNPILGRIFEPNWALIPNLGGDVIGLALLRVLPVHVAGRCLLAIALLLNLAGVLALHRAYYGRRSLWPFGSCLVAYNAAFLFGFINFLIGTGLAMLFAAFWLAWRERRPNMTVACAAAASCVLFFSHLMGLAFFLLLIGGAEVVAMRDLRAVLTRSVALIPVTAGPILLFAFTALRDAPAATHWVNPRIKLVNAASAFINYLPSLDVVSAVLVFGGLAIGVAMGRLTLAPRAVPALVLLPAAYVVLPFDLMSTSFLDERMAIMFGYLVFAALDLARVVTRTHRVMLAGMAVLFAVRMTVVAVVWTEQRRDLAELRAVIATVPPGANVYVTNVPPGEAPEYWNAAPRGRRLSNSLRTEYHLPALLLIEHGAFWPGLFANPAQQPIRLRPEYAKLAREAHDIPSHAHLMSDPSGALPGLRDFDFVLMLEAGADHDLMHFLPQCLALTATSDFAALFRVLPTCGSARSNSADR